MSGKPVKCVECGAEFTPLSSRASVCSQRCREARQRRQRAESKRRAAEREAEYAKSVKRAAAKMRECPECGAAFMPGYAAQVCCSDACKRARQLRIMKEHSARLRGRRPPKLVKCRWCGGEFVSKRGAKFCSDKCREAFRIASEYERNAKRAIRESTQTAVAEAEFERIMRNGRLRMRDNAYREWCGDAPRKVVREGGEVRETRGNCGGCGKGNDLWQHMRRFG